MLRVRVQAHPGARVERVEPMDQDCLGVWVNARTIEGQANAAIERALAAALKLRPRQVKIVGGGTSRRKIVEIELPDMDALRDRLLAYRLRSDPT